MTPKKQRQFEFLRGVVRDLRSMHARAEARRLMTFGVRDKEK